MTTAIAIIPARLGSSRFPSKVLASETGRPMVQHVVDAASRAASISSVVVAADDRRIADALVPFGTRVILTSPDHPNGTSRLAEAAAILNLAPDQIVVNVQGDEPELDPSIIDAAVHALLATSARMATVAAPMGPGDDPANPAIVKVVCRADGTALYFSRSLIPFDRDRTGASPPLRHIGLYVYRREFLDVYLNLPPTPLERSESLEQLRVLEHGYHIAVARCATGWGGGGGGGAFGGGVDTPEQYRAFVQRYRAASAP